MSAVNPYAPPQAAVADVPENQGTHLPKLWSSDGRIGRVRYLAYSFGGYLLLILTAGAVGAVAGAAGVSDGAIWFGVGFGVVYLVFAVLQTIKRCHDVSWSGWWSLLFIVPIAGAVLWLLLLFVPGSQGANRYGLPAPKMRGGAVVVVLALLAFVAIGVLAAIAIPAYQDYVTRAGAAQTK